MNLSARLTTIKKKTGNQARPILVVGLGESRPTNLPPGAVVLIETEDDKPTNSAA